VIWLNRQPAARKRRYALLVAHGSPSFPRTPESQLQALAQTVESRLEDWQLEAATLATPAALATALARFPRTADVFVYPLFISDGWFVSHELPRQLRDWQEATRFRGPRLTLLQPLGLEPALPALCLRRGEQAARAQGWRVEDCRLIIAAHGSTRDRRPRVQIERLARQLMIKGRFKEVDYGFLDQAPLLRRKNFRAARSLTLIFFAGAAAHVCKDLPDIFAAQGYQGPCVGPLGEDPALPALLAASLRHQAKENAVWGQTL
jgi:sirohydrochlorin ferrochelatase